MNPDVRPFHHADTGTFSYLVRDPGSSACAVIDPVLDFDAASGRSDTRSAGAILERIENLGLAPQWILETHAHADHLSAAYWLRSECGARIAIGAGIRQVLATFRPVFNLDEDEVPADGSRFDHLFEDGETFSIGGLQGQVIATPGHTSDSLSYLIGDALFVGDTLFMPDLGTARCDFPGGDAGTLYRSIRRLLALPESTRIFICHDYPPESRELRFETSVGEQRRDNIQVRDGISEAEYVARREARDATLDMPRLILPSLQVNLRAGELPHPEANGVRYLKLPLNQF